MHCWNFIIFRILLLWICINGIIAYWDIGTTTEYAGNWRLDQWVARTSRFRWQRSEHHFFKLFTPWWNWAEQEFRRRLYVVAGISYRKLNSIKLTITFLYIYNLIKLSPSTVKWRSLPRSDNYLGQEIRSDLYFKIYKEL